ncbi:TELO2-interacting protein 1 homolog [Bradysia coprophila]|uniref:TELO2-interacting protein 1 homolog n=1 Tax=Bradysia coprophila TaxID=38358 RepID=UPI00187D8FAD|nr:TELO2-interacting protein 1 homolog [Bradysia coprophila]
MNELSRLQPIYAEMVKNTTKETIQRVQDELKKTNPTNLQQLQDYVLLPLISKIDSETLKNNEIKVKLIDTLSDLLRVTRICKLIPLKIIVVVLLKQVFESSNVKANLSEELKLAVVECFDVAFENSTTDVRSELYVPESRALIGQIVYFCVSVIERDTYRKLRMSAINCLLSTLYINDTADFADAVLRDQISNEAYVMTPKILAVLKSIALGDEKLGHSLISLAVKGMGRYLCLIFEDYNRNVTTHGVTFEDFKALINRDASEKVIETTDRNVLKPEKNNFSPKSDEWLNAAIVKIAPTVESIKILIGNKNSTIRLELVHLSISLLEKCFKFIQPCANHLLEILLALSQDEDPCIAKLCDATVRTTLQELPFQDFVEQTFITHIIRLPRIISVGDEDEQIAGMLLLKGLLVTLQHANLKRIFAVQDTLDRFVAVLVSAVELQRDVSLLQDEYSLRNIDESEGCVVPSTWKQFKNLRSQVIVEHFQSICELIGSSNASEVVVGYLLQRLPDNVSICNEIIVLLQWLLISSDHKTSICNCLEDFLLDIHWHLAVQANKTTKMEMEEFGDTDWYEDRTEGLYESAISIRYTDVRWKGDDSVEDSNDEITIADAMFNVQHTCLILETVGHFATVLQTDFQPFLFKSLHKILEKSGSSNHAIHMAGLSALNNVKVGLNYNSVSEMIDDNSDYITYFVNLSLKKVNQSQIALDILSVVLKYSSLASIPHLENIISTVLNESSKHEQTPNMSSFLKVFQMILVRIDKWNVTTESMDGKESTEMDDDNEAELCRNWLKILQLIEDDDYRREVAFDETTFDETKFRQEQEEKLNNETETVDGIDNDSEETLPPYMDVTTQIMKRFIKYIPTKSQMDKCVVLESIVCGLNILKVKENQLLPIVHLIWKPFVERFKENDPIVLRRCFQLLIKLGEVSKDFIYQRAAKDVLPFILSFLKTSGKSSINVKDVTYEHTQQFKLQMELLQNLPALLTSIEITEKDVNSVMDAMVSYCRDDQHRQLQENCVKFLLQLAVYDATAVFVKLYQFKSTDCYKGNVNKVLHRLLYAQ